MTIPFYEGFDYGGQVAEKEDNFILWPTTGTRTCLVDADLLPYRVGFTIDETEYLAALSLVEEGHFPTVRDTPQFESAFDQLCVTLNRWIKLTKCDAAILYSTNSSTNFRLDIAYTDCYKGQRSAIKPPFFSELKKEMTTSLGCLLIDGEEADDWLSIESCTRTRALGVVAGSHMHKELSDCVIASSDKDSKITPEWNFNPDSGKIEWISLMGYLQPKYKNATVKLYEQQGTGVFNTEWVEYGTGEFYSRGAREGEEKTKKMRVPTTERTKRVCIGEQPSKAIEKLRGGGLKFFYSQIITGDAADNYRGCTGKGMTAAYEILDKCINEKQLYMATLALYKEVYGEDKHWCPHFKGTEKYAELYLENHGTLPPDWVFWKNKGAWLTAYDRMLEQGRLAWMMSYQGDIWRKEKGDVINANDREFWQDFSPV